MAKFIYCIGTKTKMNFGAYIFYQTIRHGDCIHQSVVE
jgi:hypothetical protein